jgi:hypothetical protein
VHFHIIPAFPDRSVGDKGLGIRWQPGTLEGAKGAELASKLREALV